MSSTAPTLPAVGDPIGKYRLDRQLGQGGMGIVYEATHVKLGQSVAIKILLPELVAVPELVARFEREARAAARLRHRNAARVTDVDQTDAGIPYFVMELLHGHDLEAELQARGALPVGDAVHMVLQAAAAMAEAHEHGTVHRDLKPSNLFLNQESDGSVCLKVLDFGISKVSTDDVHVTSTQTQMGTPLYMSPEQVRSAKNVDRRTDVWSLGVILYELLSGEPPFQGTAAGIGAAIVSDTPRALRELRPDVPEALEAIVARAMEKDPARRFQDMRALSRALAPFSSTPIAMPGSDPQLRISKHDLEEAATVAVPASRPDVAGTAGTWSRPQHTPKGRAWMWIVGAGALVTVGAGAAYFTARSRASEGSERMAPSALVTMTKSAPPVPVESTASAIEAVVGAASASAGSAPVASVPVASASSAARSASPPRASSSAKTPARNPDRL